MFKKLKAIKNHKFYKDFVILFFRIDTYKGHKAKKEIIPVDIDYYGWQVLTLHILWHFCYSAYMVIWWSIKYGTLYFLFEFWKRDLWIILWEIVLAFWVWRIPFLVFYINMADYAIDFYLFIKLKEYERYFELLRKKLRKFRRRRKRFKRKIGYKKYIIFRRFRLYQYNWISKFECFLSFFFQKKLIFLNLLVLINCIVLYF